jgi:tRNA pseudouridine65 synthase
VIEILYQDAHYVAVNKRSGLLVHPTKIAPDGVAVLPVLRKQLGTYVYPVHRLDRGTSGVLLFALDPEAARRFGELMEGRQVDKQYLAVVRGHTAPCGRIDHAYDDGEHQGPVDAVTDYWREGIAEAPFEVGPYPTARYSLVRARTLTGRRHQIRRHLAHVSHPVVGDTTYGDSAHNRLFRKAFRTSRLLLFASGMGFTHPYEGKRVVVTAPIPSKVGRVLAQFGWTDIVTWRDDLPKVEGCDESDHG